MEWSVRVTPELRLRFPEPTQKLTFPRHRGILSRSAVRRFSKPLAVEAVAADPATNLKVKPGKRQFAMVDKNWLLLPLQGVELKVLISLALHANWTRDGLGRCFPKRETIARECNIGVTQVSEALRRLTHLRVVTAVRLGRKNIYYVRPVGADYEMPPSNASPFFRYLRLQGITLDVKSDGSINYGAGSEKFDEHPPLLKAVFEDYVRGLKGSKLVDAISESALLLPRG